MLIIKTLIIIFFKKNFNFDLLIRIKQNNLYRF